MDSGKYKCVLISDFNVDNLAGYISNDSSPPLVDVIDAPVHQVVSVLVEKDLECWRRNPDFAVVWTQPESIVESFNSIVSYKSISIGKILKEVDEYSSLLLNILDRVKFVFVPVWAYPFNNNFGMLDMKTGVGVENTLMRMNLRLSENLDKVSNIHLLNTRNWIDSAGKNAFNPKLWYMAKIAFGNEVFKEAVKDIKSALRGLTGNSKKLIVLDLDDTLWGGIVGEVGWENIRLGGHDHIGEAYVDFQRALKSLTNRGLLLGIASKSEESVALEAIDKRPEMVLGLNDFAGWKINWQDKAQNIIDLVSDLNLGLQSVVFIDDSPVERARVREALPEVLVPEWPEDKMLYKSALLSLRCFDTPSISKEDFERTKSYISEQKRKELKRNVGSLDEWLKSLNIKAKVEKVNEANLQRTVQLLNKTNQMNLTTRRMSEAELIKWAGQENHRLWTFRVSDKFGDSGLTGIVSFEAKNGRGRIVDFVLSCRVMGRKVEETMLYTIVHYSRSIGLDEVYAKYISTPKNKPCLDFWKRSGFEYDEKEGTFKWETSENYPIPESVQIEGDLL